MAEEALHDQLLRLAFLADVQRPAPLTTEDFFWKLGQPHLPLAQIKECLEWLVRRGDLALDRGKYSLSPGRFFELRAMFPHVGPQGIAVWLAPIAPIRVPRVPVQVEVPAALEVQPPISKVEAAPSLIAEETPPVAVMETRVPEAMPAALEAPSVISPPEEPPRAIIEAQPEPTDAPVTASAPPANAPAHVAAPAPAPVTDTWEISLSAQHLQWMRRLLIAQVIFLSLLAASQFTILISGLGGVANIVLGTLTMASLIAGAFLTYRILVSAHLLRSSKRESL